MIPYARRRQEEDFTGSGVAPGGLSHTRNRSPGTEHDVPSVSAINANSGHPGARESNTDKCEVNPGDVRATLQFYKNGCKFYDLAVAASAATLRLDCYLLSRRTCEKWRFTQILAENILHLVEEVRRSLDRLVFHSHRLPELFKQSALLARHLGRNLHTNTHVQVAASAVGIGEAF